MPKATPLERFTAKYVIADDGCWQWTGSMKSNGYGSFWSGERVTYAHRWSYEHSVGPISDGLQIDHLCRNRACVNPTHLEAVTCRINLLRGNTQTARRAAVTHCPQGHPYDEANTYRRPDNGGRDCRTCRTIAANKSSLKVRAAMKAAGIRRTHR